MTGGTIYTTNGIQPHTGGLILAADDYNDSIFSNDALTTTNFQIISNSNGGGTGLFKVYNNISGSPLVEIEGTSDSLSLTSGSLVVKGGLGVSKTITASSVTGSSGFFSSVTGTIVNAGTLSTTSVTGNSGFFTTVTVTGSITVEGLTGVSSIVASTFTGSNAFMMQSVETDGVLEFRKY